MKARACPFCGEAPRVATKHAESLFSHTIVMWWAIDCGTCDVRMSSEHMVDLFRRWNTRRRPRATS